MQTFEVKDKIQYVNGTIITVNNKHKCPNNYALTVTAIVSLY